MARCSQRSALSRPVQARAGSGRCSASTRSVRPPRRRRAASGAARAFQWPSATRRGTYTPARGSGSFGRSAGPPERPAPAAAGIARGTSFRRGDGRAARRPRPRSAPRPRRCRQASHAPDLPSGSSRFCEFYPPRTPCPRCRRGESSRCSGSGRGWCPAAMRAPARRASRGGTARRDRWRSRCPRRRE